MDKIDKFVLIGIVGVLLLYTALQFIIISPFIPVKEKFVESFDKQYMYIQLKSPKKSISTIVILEESTSGREISYSLPYFNGRTVKIVEWGVNSNDLFVLSSDTGLHVYRQEDDGWKILHIMVENNQDGSSIYYLCENGERHSEISSDTIPTAIKNSSHWRKYY